jgi:anti-sigma regulatory factor (Ser/Thr protein kinase)
LGRLVTGSLGAQQGCEEEAITDMKLVVSELSSFYFNGSCTALHLQFNVGPTAWELVISDPNCSTRLPAGMFIDPSTDKNLGLTIVEALVDEVEQADDPDRGTVFRVRTQVKPADQAD